MTDENQNKGQVVAGLIKQLGDNYLAEKKRADAATTELETARGEYTNLNRDYLALASERDIANNTLNTVRGEKSQLEQVLTEKNSALNEKDTTIANQTKQLAMYESIFAGMENDLKDYLGINHKQ